MKQRLLTAHYDDDSGELVAIKWSEGFVAENALLRADVLQDLKAQIDQSYGAAYRQAFPGTVTPTAKHANRTTQS